ncbi:MAG: 8-amino-7-oxononanoate synthase [Hormoscilla sp.]
MVSDPYGWLEKSLETIHRANWYRQVVTIDSRPGPVVQLAGRSVLNFASNDYLGLAGDPRLIQAAVSATEAWGTGSTGSRLLSGHRQLHRDTERAIASFKQTADAMVFSSGYLANLGAIAAVVGKRDLILSDRYNHSSLKNGALLSGARVLDYGHCNIEDLKSKLHQHREEYRRCAIVTDSVFSMDGDLCPLPELLDLAAEFGCMLLIDEAHATGVLGATGAGCVEHFGLRGRELIQVGTLSKALGSLGGYVAGSEMLIDFLRNRAPGWIYTTGLTPADTAAAYEAIGICQREPQRRAQLWQNITYTKQLISQQLPLCQLFPSESAIICIKLENAADALTVGEKLKAAGIFAPAIRPPTVSTSRIRISLMATHEATHLHQLVAALDRIIPPRGEAL